MKKLQLFIILISAAFLSIQCDKNNDIVFFSIETDKKLGEQADSAVRADTQFSILDRSTNAQAYAYLQEIVDDILESGEVTYRDQFAWEVTIIEDDNTLNAFATPGGYIYVYTGLIKYLDTEDDLAGVLGHEIAHADQRHSMKQIQQQYSISAATSIILGGNSGQLEQIIAGVTGQLASLKFSRNHEQEADEYSVRYLSKTDYACNSAASFFAKLIAEEQTGGTPEFLSTHPNPENRVADINKEAEDRNCNTSPLDPDSYEAFKAMLP